MKMGGIGAVAFVLGSLAACGDDASSTGSGGGGSGGAGSGGGGGLPAGLECVGSVVLETTNEATLDFSFRLDGLPQADVGDDVSIDFCSSEDLTCANPLLTTVTDANGEATVALPMEANGFEGFAQLTGTGVKPQVIWANIPFIPDPAFPYVYPAYDEAAFNGLFTTLFGVAADPAKGQVLLNTANCGGNQLTGGITIEITGATSVVYGENGVPSSTLTATSADGSAFGLNVTPGPVTITGTLEGTSTVYATFTVDVRPDALTIVYMEPAP